MDKSVYFCKMQPKKDKIQRFKKRNEKVRTLFEKVSAQNEKWRVDAVIEYVADQVFLSERTVEAIIKHEGIYA